MQVSINNELSVEFSPEYPCYFCQHIGDNPVCDSCLNFYDYVLAKEAVEMNFRQLYVEKEIVEYCYNCGVTPVNSEDEYCAACLQDMTEAMLETERILQPLNPFLWDN